MKRGGLIALAVFLILLFIGLILLLIYAIHRLIFPFPFDDYNSTTTLVAEPPDYSFQLKNGSSFEILCRYNGYEDGLQELRWIDPDGFDIGGNGPHIEDRNPYTIFRDSPFSSMLIFRNGTDKMNGVYTCAGGYRRHQTRLKLFREIEFVDERVPIFIPDHELVKAKLEQQLEVSCEATGESPISYVWYNENGQALSWTSVLAFRKFKESENGLYTCIALNRFGQASKIFEIQADTDGAPKFEKDHQNVTAVKGSKLELLCCDPNATEVTYKWINQEGEEVPENSEFPVHASPTEKGSVLTINSMESNYSGVYSCHANNSYGTAFTNFDIQVDPATENVPNFEEEYETVLAKEGSKLEVACFATGQGPIEYTWFKEDIEAIGNDANSSIYVMENSTNESLLTITDVQKSDSGSYTCKAENEHGSSGKVFSVVVYPEPGDETNKTSVHFAEILKVTVDSIFFAVATDESVDTIEVKYIDTWSGGVQKTTFKKDEPYELKGLYRGAVYNISFRVSEPTNGSWSDVYRVALLPRKPEVIFRVVSDDMVEVELFTTIEERMRGDIDKYELTYKTVQIRNGDIWDPNTCSSTIVKPACAGTTFTIAGLNRKVYYDLSVRGHSEAGYGEPYAQKFYLD